MKGAKRRTKTREGSEREALGEEEALQCVEEEKKRDGGHDAEVELIGSHQLVNLQHRVLNVHYRMSRGGGTREPFCFCT
jgi:hypothetical protein